MRNIDRVWVELGGSPTGSSEEWDALCCHTFGQFSDSGLRLISRAVGNMRGTSPAEQDACLPACLVLRIRSSAGGASSKHPHARVHAVAVTLASVTTAAVRWPHTRRWGTLQLSCLFLYSSVAQIMNPK